MTQEEIMRMAREAGLQPYYDEQLTAIARFAAIVAATEREKCTGTQEFVTLPREVVEQALEALINEGEFRKLLKPLIEKSIDSIREALDQPDAGIPATVPEGWKLVPVDPTREMLRSAFPASGPVTANAVYRAMLAAAPQPPKHYDQQALDLCLTCGWKTLIPGDCCLNCARQKPPAVEQLTMSGAMRDLIEGMSVSVDVSTGEHDAGRRYFGTVTEVMDAPEDKHGVTLLVQDAEPNFEQPQVEHEPVSWIENFGGSVAYGPIQEAARKLPKGVRFDLYTNPQPKREPLTDE